MARNNTGNGFKCMQILLIMFVAELIIITGCETLSGLCVGLVKCGQPPQHGVGSTWMLQHCGCNAAQQSMGITQKSPTVP